MMPHPNGDIYVTDGYRNSRVHRFTRDGRLVKSWGTPGKAEASFTSSQHCDRPGGQALRCRSRQQARADFLA